MELYLEGNTEEDKEGITSDEGVMLRGRIRYLDNHMHFQNSVTPDITEPQFKATLIDDQVEIFPLGGPLPDPQFYSRGRNPQVHSNVRPKEILDVKVEEERYTVSLSEDVSDTRSLPTKSKIQREEEWQDNTSPLIYILHRNPQPSPSDSE